MTFFHSMIELLSANFDNTPLPEPRAPEEVIYLLTQEAPVGEHCVDAF